MSTPSVTILKNLVLNWESNQMEEETIATFYRHWDGYPSCHAIDIANSLVVASRTKPEQHIDFSGASVERDILNNRNWCQHFLKAMCMADADIEFIGEDNVPSASYTYVVTGAYDNFGGKVGIGAEKKSRVISEKEKKITAYHEAGHAILFHVLPDVGPVYTVSIIPTGVGAAGYTMPLPEKDEMFATKSRMLQDIMVSLGGRIAEEIIFGDITTGASSDIKKATKTARRMVTRYGMSDNIGVICYDDDDDEVFIGKDLAHAKAHSEEISGEIDKEVKRIIDDCYTKAKDIIMQHENVLHSCAKLLLEKEKINREEFEALFV